MKNGIELVKTKSTVGEINLHLQLTPAYRQDIFANEQVKQLTKIYFLEKANKLKVIVASPEEHKLITTNPNERLEKTKVKPKKAKKPETKKKAKKPKPKKLVSVTAKKEIKKTEKKNKVAKVRKEIKKKGKPKKKKTKPKVRLKREKPQEPVKIRANERGRFYKKADLAKIEIDYLLNKGYKEVSLRNINSLGHEPYLLKP